MVQYLMMDESHILPYCLHKGPAPVSDLASPEEARARAESEWGLPHGPVVEFLRAVARTYGATGVMAVDGDMVIGKVRFAPMALLSAVKTSTHGPVGDGCVQSADEVNAIAAIDLEHLVRKDDLSPKPLAIWCVQLASGYAGRGIGANLISRTIDWARENGWDEIHWVATRHIRPLLDWTGLQSMDRLSRFGFVEAGHFVSPELKEGVASMRGGYHGEEVRKQWEQHSDLSDDEASWVYTAVLDLR